MKRNVQQVSASGGCPVTGGNERRGSLEAQVREEFPSDRSQAVLEDLSVRFGDPDHDELCARVMSKEWTEIDPQEFADDYIWFDYLGETATCYYLPVLLMAAIRGDDHALHILVDYSLLPPKKPELLTKLCEHFRQLTQRQRETVCDVLLYLKDQLPPGNERLPKRIIGSIERYWGTAWQG